MSNLGFGAMIGMLSGNEETVNTFNAAMDKKISAIEINENERLQIKLADGSGIELWDDAQSCCEHRWMHTDDDLDAFVGATLQGAEIRDSGKAEGEYGDVKESQFLIVSTSLGQFTVVNYNEHNGYYGGFWIVCTPIC